MITAKTFTRNYFDKKNYPVPVKEAYSVDLGAVLSRQYSLVSAALLICDIYTLQVCKVKVSQNLQVVKKIIMSGSTAAGC